MENNYRFAIGSDGEIVSFQPDFQREVYHRYLEVNGLTEWNAMDAYTDWKELQEGLSDEELESEQPSPLPEKYAGDIYEELFEIYVDLSSIGIFAYDPEVCFDDMAGMTPYYYDFDGDTHDIPYHRVCEVLVRLGYEVHEEKNGEETIYFIC